MTALVLEEDDGGWGGVVLDSQHPCGGPQPTTTPVPAGAMPSSDLCRHPAYMHCTYTRAGKTPPHIQINK